jgi:hypothetical protein
VKRPLGWTAANEAEAEASGRLWAAMMLTHDVRTCDSALRGLPVRAGNLDGLVLRRALRGGSLPHPETYITVTGEMLAAVNEAGPLPVRRKEKKR